jgi:hypothetical protein
MDVNVCSTSFRQFFFSTLSFVGCLIKNLHSLELRNCRVLGEPVLLSDALQIFFFFFEMCQNRQIWGKTGRAGNAAGVGNASDWPISWGVSDAPPLISATISGHADPSPALPR